MSSIHKFLLLLITQTYILEAIKIIPIHKPDKTRHSTLLTKNSLHRDMLAKYSSISGPCLHRCSPDTKIACDYLFSYLIIREKEMQANHFNYESLSNLDKENFILDSCQMMCSAIESGCSEAIVDFAYNAGINHKVFSSKELDNIEDKIEHELAWTYFIKNVISSVKMYGNTIYEGFWKVIFQPTLIYVAGIGLAILALTVCFYSMKMVCKNMNSPLW